MGSTKKCIPSIKKSIRCTAKKLKRFQYYMDEFTCKHSKSVAKYSIKIARALGFNEHDMLKIEIAAFLHDIGKSKTDKAILYKPGKLTKKERQKIKKHSAKSADIIKTKGILSEIGEIVAHHHKHFDGNGYPGLKKKGRRIPLGSRILSVADSYDAMTSKRPYREKPMTREVAIEELRRCAGTQFDPGIVRTFIAVLGKN